MMKRLIHLSDLHFGKVDSATLTPLIDFVKESKCDLAIISGDLTQRARVSQFTEAKKFLDALAVKQIIIPGNHDIPLFKIWLRFFRPFRNFMKIISKEIEPSYSDDEVAILGVSTVSLWKVEGSFSDQRFRRLAERFRALTPGLLKILVTHHPVPPHLLEKAGLSFDLLLAGHEHAADSLIHVVEKSGKHLSIQAGTATSTRLRHGLSNSFNIIEIDQKIVRVVHYEWLRSENLFRVSKEGTYQKTELGWVSTKAPHS